MSRPTHPHAFRCLLLPLLVACACLRPPSLPGRDAFVLISGGGSPFENNYSQYLQAKAVAEGLSRGRPTNSVWIFFGAGNREGVPPVFGDVRRKVKEGRRSFDSWLPGTLPANRPARRDAILQTFENEILPTVADGGRLFLFVGDHGSRSPDGMDESVITLWGLTPDPSSGHGWRFDENEMLRVSELREVMLHGLGKGRVIFCMTQCHSGGFHSLGIPHEMSPNPAWFLALPGWFTNSPPFQSLRIAGFTAADEMSLASGCDAEPTDEEWEGYERYFPGKLFGVDPLTLSREGRPLRSFVAAHVEAVLADRTIDNPYSTSHQYLERWAELIESRLSGCPTLAPAVRQAVERYWSRVNGVEPVLSDRLLREQQAMFRRFTASLIEQLPEQARLLRSGPGPELAKLAAASQGTPAPEGGEAGGESPSTQPRKGRGSPEMRKLWAEVVRPAWGAALRSGEAAATVGKAAQFEASLLRQEEGGREIFFEPRGSLEMDVYWHSGYADPGTVNPEIAQAVVRWGTERRRRILAWARASKEAPIREAAEKLSRRPRPRRDAPPPAPPGSVTAPEPGPVSAEPIALETAAARVLFYRRVLAAYAFLDEVHESSALLQVRDLIKIESTPFPR